MEYAVLYYPSFQPDIGWLRKILLLTDGVARIVPSDADTEDPAPLLDLLNVVPEGLTNLPPNPRDVSLDDLKGEPGEYYLEIQASDGRLGYDNLGNAAPRHCPVL